MFLAVVVTACGGADADPLIGIRASTDPAVGDDRFLFALNEIDGRRRGSPEEIVMVEASPLAAPDTVIEAEAQFVWVVPDSFGLYRVTIPFDVAGTWQIDFTVSTGEPTDPFLVDVAEAPATVAIGAAAPAVATPTVPETAIEDLTTDPEPMASMYAASLDELVGNGRPTVALFATPAYCVSASCGPLVEHVKEIAATRDDADFIHIEVYEGFNEPGFAPDADHLVPAVSAYGLPSEPWVFVIDDSGVVAGRFEGVLGDGELEALLDSF